MRAVTDHRYILAPEDVTKLRQGWGTRVGTLRDGVIKKTGATENEIIYTLLDFSSPPSPPPGAGYYESGCLHQGVISSSRIN